MNHNEWADPDKWFGGWVVPDALTDGQKERVKAYFQANPNLSYEDPHFFHFFVQQVYTGGTSAPETGNKESTKAADGTVHAGSTLNQLTVGEACSHINDFNAGTCSASNVLDNGSNVNNGTYHSDQITLMVNVYDTSCFGYHETGGSNVKGVINHNDKMALVSAATIDAWAAANGNPGEAVTDKWNRSFMGFDYELLPESDIVTDTYARLDAVPNLNNIPYAWDGEKVLTIGTAPEATEAEEVDITSTFAQNASGNDATCAYNENGKIVCTFGPYSAVTFNQTGDWGSYSKLVIEFEEPSPFSGTLQCTKGATITKGDPQVEVELSGESWTGYYGPTISTYTGEGGTLIIKKVTLVKEASAAGNPADYYNPTYLLGDNDEDKVAFYSTNTNMYGGIVRNVTEDEMKTTQDGKVCLNLPFFQNLVADGYHPISTDLKKWVKWEAACDGYYSDWIVTLTQAQRITPDAVSLRVMGEDLSSTEASDFDFNDVVFDVIRVSDTEAKIILQAAGGTLPLRINCKANGEGGWEVHQEFDVQTYTMVNTKAQEIGLNGADRAPVELGTVTGNFTVANFNQAVKDINVMVLKSYKGENGELVEKWYPLQAEVGEPASKVGVPTSLMWAKERTNVNSSFNFTQWVQNANVQLVSNQ
jgi:hypothetical protein